MTQELETKSLEGIGGWLILVGIGLLVTPFRIMLEIFTIYSKVFKDNSWQLLTTPGTELYHPFWAPFLIGEIIINIGLVSASFYLIYLFINKKMLFPKLYIVLLVSSLLITLIDAALIKVIIPDHPMFDHETIRDVAKLVLASVIWIPYMLVSKRVKATFVR